MLKPTVPHLRRLKIRPGHWGQWLATGTAGLVGFVVLALLLVFETDIGQLDQRLLSGVISLRSPGLTAFASAVTRLGSASVVVPLGTCRSRDTRASITQDPAAHRIARNAGSNREPGHHPQDRARPPATAG